MRCSAGSEGLQHDRATRSGVLVGGMRQLKEDLVEHVVRRTCGATSLLKAHLALGSPPAAESVAVRVLDDLNLQTVHQHAHSLECIACLHEIRACRSESMHAGGSGARFIRKRKPPRIAVRFARTCRPARHRHLQGARATSGHFEILSVKNTNSFLKGSQSDDTTRDVRNGGGDLRDPTGLAAASWRARART